MLAAFSPDTLRKLTLKSSPNFDRNATRFCYKTDLKNTSRGPKCLRNASPKCFLEFWETHACKVVASSEKRTSGIYFWSTYTLTLSRRRVETLACVETHRSLICQTFTVFIFQMGLSCFLYNIFCFTMWDLTSQFEGIVTHLLASLRSAFYRTSNIWQSSITINQQKFFDEPRFTWIQCAFYYCFASCPMRNLRWPMADITILFFPLSYRAILFTLSEKVRARDKVYFDWEIYRTITF